MPPVIVLASSSPYRKELLSRVIPHFEAVSPDIDESPRDNEKPAALAERLAIQKAEAISERYDHALVIGSDQVAFINNQIIGKPDNHEEAVEQLLCSSGSVVTLFTGLAVINSKCGTMQSMVDQYEVEFRDLDLPTIEHYLAIDRPYDCCGSLKTEGLGISLLKRLSGNDPNTLIGLPLIALITMLTKEGFDPLDHWNQPN